MSPQSWVSVATYLVSSVDGCTADVKLSCHVNFHDQKIKIVWVAAKRKQKLLRVILHSPSTRGIHISNTYG